MGASAGAGWTLPFGAAPASGARLRPRKKLERDAFSYNRHPARSLGFGHGLPANAFRVCREGEPTPPGAERPSGGPTAVAFLPGQFVICATSSALLNILFSAAVMSSGVFAVKKKPGEAHFSKLAGIYGMLLLA